MQHNESRHFRTHTIRFMKKDIREERNYRSLFTRMQKKKHFYCGSLLQVIKFCQKERKNRINSSTTHFLTITNDFESRHSQKQQQTNQHTNLSQFYSTYNANPLKIDLKNKFRIKQSPKSDTARKEQQKVEFQKLICDFNTKTKEILSRKERNILFRSSIQKDNKDCGKPSQMNHNFYQFRTLKNFKQTLSTKQESEDVQINYEITPW